MDHFIATITRAPIFSGLSREDLARVAGKLDEITVAAGTTVIRQGDPGDALYIVREGAVEIMNAGDRGEAERIAILGPRECFGEIAIFTGARRTANVVAVIDTSLLRLSKEACEELVTQCPGFSLHICRLLGQRLVERGRELARSQVSRDAVLTEFLAAQASETQALLQRASVLKTISPGALAVLGDAPPDLDTLTLLAERYPRLVEANGHGGFTLHAGLRAFLIAQLTPVDSQTLHRRAAAHFESTESWDAAIDHHLDAGDWAEAVRVLERWGDDLLDRESTPELLARLDTLPLVTGRSRFHLLRLRVKAHAIRDELEPALHGCRELLAPAHGPSLGAVASAFAYQVRLAELHRDRGEGPDALRSLRDALAVLEPGAGRGRAAPAPPGSSAAAPSRRTLSLKWLHVVPALAIGVVIWHLPPPAPLDAVGMRFLATLAVAVVLWSVNVFDDFLVAIALLSAWIVAGIARPEVALSGFTKPSWFLFVGALGIGAGVTRSGLLYRAALALVRRVRPSYASYTAILTLAGVLATPALPSMTGRMAVVAPVSWAIAESVGFAPRSPGAAGLVLATFLGFSLLGFAFLTGSTGGLLGWNAMPDAARAEFGWTAWAVAAAPAGLLMVGGLWVAIHLLFRLPADGGVRVSRERLQAQLDILGPFTRREAFSLGVLVLALAGWSTTPLHGIGEAWVALGGLVLFFLGGVLDRGSFRANVDLGFLLFLGVVSSLSAVVSAVKADRWLMALVTPVLEAAAVHATVLLLAVAVVTMAVRFILNKFAATILLTLVLTPIGAELGVHPGVVLLVILLSVDVWFFPYQLDVYQIAYFGTGGQGFSHAQGRRFMLAKLVVALLAVAVSVPWWRMLGLVR